jgi:catechol 2,3-dioxygenase-like lactoylglutathione lyase family enzyme
MLPSVRSPSRQSGTAERVHHVGMTVASLEAALAFWEAFLGVEARWRTVLERPYLGRHVGYPGVTIDAAFVDLPGGIVLELLAYRVDDATTLPEATANPGNIHLCLEVADAQSAWERAVSLGARPVVPDGPVDVDGGPNRGARAAYVRIHDGITLELFQPPPR